MHLSPVYWYNFWIIVLPFFWRFLYGLIHWRVYAPFDLVPLNHKSIMYIGPLNRIQFQYLLTLDDCKNICSN